MTTTFPVSSPLSKNKIQIVDAASPNDVKNFSIERTEFSDGNSASPSGKTGFVSKPKSASEWKDEGNRALASKNYRQALEAYDRALNVCDKHVDASSLSSILLNRVVVLIELQDFVAAERSCTHLLEHPVTQHSHFQALYLRALARESRVKQMMQSSLSSSKISAQQILLQKDLIMMAKLDLQSSLKALEANETIGGTERSATQKMVADAARRIQLLLLQQAKLEQAAPTEAGSPSVPSPQTAAKSHSPPTQIAPRTQNRLNVALIGSSGGGTATLGHTEAITLLRTIHRHLTSINAHLVQAIYITLADGKSMDSAVPTVDLASLTVAKIGSGPELECEIVATDTLGRINDMAHRLQQLLASEIRNGTIHALISVSINVTLFADVLQAAADVSLPVTGSGGSSLAQAVVRFPGLLLAGNVGGSVATTTQTRAISYTYSLARALNRASQYRPWETKHAQPQPSWTSILNATLPAFWAVTLTKYALAEITIPAIELAERWIPGPGIGKHELEFGLFTLDHFVLPAVCAAVMSISYRSVSSVEGSTTSTASLVMASLVASLGCRDSVFAGLISGYLVQEVMERWVIYPCIFANVPATMTTLLAGGGCGGVVGTLMCVLISPLARQTTEAIRSSIQWTITESRTLFPEAPFAAAFFLGCLSCWSSKVGYYHAVHLPLILIELESGNGSFLGAVDELTLVLVCAGICAAKLLHWKTTTTDRALCRRGLLINILAGDFVEVCYPYMEQSWLLNVAGYLASGLSCAALVWQSHDRNSAHPPHSLAYLPWPVSVALSGENWSAMLIASLIAFGIPFIASMIADTLARRKPMPLDFTSKKSA